MQAVTEVLVRLHREETERRVGRPVEPNTILASAYLGLGYPVAAQGPRDGVARRLEHLRVRCRGSGNAGGGVMEDVQVVGKARTIGAAIDDGTTGDMACGVSVLREDVGDPPLE